MERLLIANGKHPYGRMRCRIGFDWMKDKKTRLGTTTFENIHTGNTEDWLQGGMVL